MKPQLLKFNLEPAHSFDVQKLSIPHFYNKWQSHPEMELVYILKGSGRQFIGDNVHHFKPGDMLLLGADLPHLWRNEDKYLRKDSPLRAEAIVIHFLPECLGEYFFSLPENKSLILLFERAKQAVRIKNETKKIVAELMEKILLAKATERIILLLQILHIIAASSETKPVCNMGLEFHYHSAESDRLNNIYQYILKNFKKEITLPQIARVAHMSPHSFCRYFKSRIRKTFSKFLLEVRIGHACKLLAETNKSVAEVCYSSGFNSFSNFNRHFKSITGNTPLKHRSRYQNVPGRADKK